jgi:hypothetical protein
MIWLGLGGNYYADARLRIIMLGLTSDDNGHNNSRHVEEAVLAGLTA